MSGAKEPGCLSVSVGPLLSQSTPMGNGTVEGREPLLKDKLKKFLSMGRMGQNRGTLASGRNFACKIP